MKETLNERLLREAKGREARLIIAVNVRDRWIRDMESHNRVRKSAMREKVLRRAWNFFGRLEREAEKRLRDLDRALNRRMLALDAAIVKREIALGLSESLNNPQNQTEKVAETEKPEGIRRNRGGRVIMSSDHFARVYGKPTRGLVKHVGRRNWVSG